VLRTDSPYRGTVVVVVVVVEKKKEKRKLKKGDLKFWGWGRRYSGCIFTVIVIVVELD
jgi:hypothetical protein